MHMRRGVLCAGRGTVVGVAEHLIQAAGVCCSGTACHGGQRAVLYGRTRVYFPIPKLYVLQVGLEMKADHLPKKVQYDVRLSESYLSAESKYGEHTPEPDLDATAHVYDFRMTLDEVLSYIERGDLPERFMAYGSDMRNYALVANGDNLYAEDRE